MTNFDAPRIEYVEARRVLLHALDALRPHLDAVVLVGAQAVYLRTAGRIGVLPEHTVVAAIAAYAGELRIILDSG